MEIFRDRVALGVLSRMAQVRQLWPDLSGGTSIARWVERRVWLHVTQDTCRASSADPSFKTSKFPSSHHQIVKHSNTKPQTSTVQRTEPNHSYDGRLPSSSPCRRRTMSAGRRSRFIRPRACAIGVRPRRVLRARANKPRPRRAKQRRIRVRLLTPARTLVDGSWTERHALDGVRCAPSCSRTSPAAARTSGSTRLVGTSRATWRRRRMASPSSARWRRDVRERRTRPSGTMAVPRSISE